MEDSTEHDFTIPVSAGIPPLVKAAVVVTIIFVFVILSLVFRNSGFGHAWPASTSTQIKL